MSTVIQFSELQAVAEIRGEKASRQKGRGANGSANNVVRFWTTCPHSDSITEYDMHNLSFFALLLHSEFEGGSERHMAETFFRIKVDRHPGWAANVVRTHLARAHWIKNNVFPLLDW
jgi:hypothetical protein